MTALFTDTFPIILIAFIGYLLKVFKVLRAEQGDLLLRLVFYVSLPALILMSFSEITLTMQYAYLPFITASIIASMFGLSYLIGKTLKLPGPRLGVFIIGTMILNNGFLLPFVIAAYGDEGLTRLLIFDFMNALLAFTWVYFIACKYGGNSHDRKTLFRKFLYSPPIWAIVISIIMNLTQVKAPAVLLNTFQLAGDTTVPLIMLSLGVYFTPRLVYPRGIIAGIIIRMCVGLLIGYGLSEIFGLTGLTRLIVLLGSSAPIGFNTITFASMENLDREFAASLVSTAIVTGIIYVPLFIYFMG